MITGAGAPASNVDSFLIWSTFRKEDLERIGEPGSIGGWGEVLNWNPNWNVGSIGQLIDIMFLIV